MLKNPFVIYILAFGGALATYQLGWSQLYPALSRDMLAFFGLTFLVTAVLAAAVFREVDETRQYQPGQIPRYTVLVLIGAYAADIAYGGELPLLSLIMGTYQYAGFPGMPTLHVFAVTASGTFATIRFADFLYSAGWRRRAHYLLEALIPLLFFALLNMRGMVVIAFLSWIFVFLIKRGRLGAAHGFVIAVVGLGALYLFGAFGDVRTGGIEELGAPTRAFTESGVPRTYFWGYLYFTSPLANFQYTVNIADPGFGPRDGFEFFAAEMLPDFLSNRILPLLGTARLATPEVGPGLNVATIFARSYLYFGWIGVLLMFYWFFTLILVYLWRISKSPYRVPCLALLNTTVFFCTFDNMIAQTFLFAQLIWPLLLPLLPRRNPISRWFVGGPTEPIGLESGGPA
jgi:hypothetical protein